MTGIWRGMIYSGLFLGLSQPVMVAAQDPVGPPAPGESPGKVEPGTGDSLKQVAADVAALKKRMKGLEDQLAEVGPAGGASLQNVAEKIKTLHASVEKLQQDMAAMRDAGRTIVPTAAMEPRKTFEEATALKPEMGSMHDQFSALSKKMDDILKLNLQVQANTRDLSEVKRAQQGMQTDIASAQSEINRLQQEMGRLRNQMDSLRNSNDVGRDDLQRRYSGSLPLPTPPDSTATPGAARPAMGTVRLINSYLFPVQVVVDGKWYPLATNDTLSLDRAPGTFTYEVVGIQGNTLRSINAGETLTIRVVPR